MAVLVLLLSFSSISVSAEAKVYRKKDSVGKKIALTFDDGPHPRLTPKILEVLEKYNIKATFFVIGQNVEYYPDAMKLLAESGCEIGNHTFTHRDLREMSEGNIMNELKRAQEVLSDRYGASPSILRPPRGMYGDSLRSVAKELDLDIILWSIDTRDWAHTPSEKIAENILSNVSEGDIILMHDYVAGESPTCRALEMFIPELISRGYEFVTVSELIEQ